MWILTLRILLLCDDSAAKTKFIVSYIYLDVCLASDHQNQQPDLSIKNQRHQNLLVNLKSVNKCTIF